MNLHHKIAAMLLSSAILSCLCVAMEKPQHKKQEGKISRSYSHLATISTEGSIFFENTILLPTISSESEEVPINNNEPLSPIPFPKSQKRSGTENYTPSPEQNLTEIQCSSNLRILLPNSDKKERK